MNGKQILDQNKILIVASSDFFSNYGGGQTYLKSLVDEMIDQGHYPIIVCPGDQKEIINYRGARIIFFPPGADNPFITKLLKSEKPDLVHAHGFKAHFANACKELGIPIIITAHHGGILCPAGALLNHKDQICKIKANPKDCLPCVLKNTTGGIYSWPILKAIPKKYRLRVAKLIKKIPFLFYITPVATAFLSIENKLEKWQSIYRNCALIIAPSRAIAESMVINGAPRKKIEIVPHGIPLPNLTESKQNFESKSATADFLKFFYVGRISYVKGVHIMLAAFNKVQTKDELHIIGGSGNRKEERYFSRLKKKYASNKKIIWHGKINADKIYERIKLYDVMIHPAIFLEVFGLTIAEALSLEKPVIATRCGGSEMQITDGVNGILVKPNSAEDMEKAILEYIKGKSKNKTLEEYIPGSVTAIEDHVHSLREVYNRVVSQYSS